MTSTTLTAQLLILARLCFPPFRFSYFLSNYRTDLNEWSIIHLILLGLGHFYGSKHVLYMSSPPVGCSTDPAASFLAARYPPRTIESSCPWGWAPGCLYNSYVFDAQLKTDTTAESVSCDCLMNDLRLPLHRIPSRTKGKLSVCVPPIYWGLIFFLETWRAHGANHVFMYYHSSTKDVRRVLDHYQKEVFDFSSWRCVGRMPMPNRFEKFQSISFYFLHLGWEKEYKEEVFDR
ncbi:unnamed protein product [Haemonchus placei]|uniref:Glycosyltransferase family 92 protein n=1 Tax=Haemonchus placei TaxID=6290 RepID=A0A0N4VWT0_HAEPC|nr:unnamed protein product [Haemonchus placei]